MLTPLADDARFELLRVITIDSYSQGGETLLRVEGGAILTGDNGAGKTSLIRLIPVFYGELPKRITLGSLSFADFYLARSTSYIIFEYLQRGEPRLAVMYSNAADATVQAFTYRFIRAPYSLDLFTTDGRTLVSNDHLSTHLKMKGVTFSRALSHDAYRSIIQGRVHAGKEAAANRSLVADYAFTASNSRLDHIDRIVSGMFHRKAEFNDFLRMVVSYISDKNDAFTIPGDRAQLANWPRQYAAYQKVMECASIMPEILERETKIKGAEHQLAIAHAKARKLAQHALIKYQRAEEAAALMKVSLNEEENEFQVKDAAFVASETEFRSEAEAKEREVSGLDQTKKVFEGERIDDKVALVALLPKLETDIQSARDRHKVILGTKNEIEEKFTAQKQEELNFMQERKEGLQSERDEVTEKFDSRIEGFRAEQEPLEEDARSRFGAQIEGLRSEQLAVAKEVAVIRTKIQNPNAAPEVLQLNEEKVQARITAQRAIAEPRAKLAEATRLVGSAKADYESMDKRVLQLAHDIEAVDRRIADLKRQSVPDQHSLLAFLRNEKPSWGADVAKVINESLLARTDLSPALMEDVGQSFYGIELDLAKIENPLVADEDRLLQEIQQNESHRAELKRQHANDQEGLARLLAKLEQARQVEAIAEQAVIGAEALLNIAGQEEAASRQAVNQSLRENKQRFEAEESTLLEKQKTKDSALHDAQRFMEQAIAKIKADTRAGLDRLAKEKKDAINGITKRIEENEKDSRAKVATIDQQRISALANEGVDMKTLNALDEEIRGLEQKQTAARKAQSRVTEWNAWLESQWSQRARLEKAGKSARIREGEVKLQRNTAKDAWNERREQLQSDISRISSEAAHARELNENAGRLIHNHRLEDYAPDPETEKLEYDPVWTLEHMATVSQTAKRERDIFYGDLKIRVNEIKRAFRAGAGTPVGDFFALQQDSVDIDDDNPRAWVAPFTSWFDDKHKQDLSSLLLQARRFGSFIMGFHREIDDFSREITNFNRRMQDALDKVTVFARISKIKINFNSTLTTKEYWGPIRDFIRNNDHWILSQSNEPPPASYAHDLDRVLEHWDIREGVRAERISLIDVSGEVTENGVEKKFRDGKGMKELSSNGLSYLILTIIFVGFLRMIRGSANVRVTYAVDELGDLDIKNIGIMVDMLHQNGIGLVSATPGADIAVLSQFKNRYRVKRDTRGPALVEIEIAELEAEYV